MHLRARIGYLRVKYNERVPEWEWHMFRNRRVVHIRPLSVLRPQLIIAFCEIYRPHIIAYDIRRSICFKDVQIFNYLKSQFKYNVHNVIHSSSITWVSKWNPKTCEYIIISNKFICDRLCETLFHINNDDHYVNYIRKIDRRLRIYLLSYSDNSKLWLTIRNDMPDIYHDILHDVPIPRVFNYNNFDMKIALYQDGYVNKDTLFDAALASSQSLCRLFSQNILSRDDITFDNMLDVILRIDYDAFQRMTYHMNISSLYIYLVLISYITVITIPIMLSLF